MASAATLALENPQQLVEVNDLEGGGGERGGRCVLEGESRSCRRRGRSGLEAGLLGVASLLLLLLLLGKVLERGRWQGGGWSLL